MDDTQQPRPPTLRESCGDVVNELEHWTAADAAELDVLIYELVRVHRIHVPPCEICSKGGPWCSRMRGAFEAILDWRQARELRSRAAWLLLVEPPPKRAAA